MKINDASSIVQHFVSVIVENSNEYNAQEVTNLLWALSKLEIEVDENSDAVVALLERLLHPNIISNIKAQEAANALYACGSMMICDEEIFSKMSLILLKNVNDATPQGIANALWAHEQVGLIPPQSLFDGWAEVKLGIITRF